MTESDARQAVLLRAFEDPLAPPWTEADRAAATHEAARALGEAAAADRFIARRAAVAAPRLTQRVPALASALAATTAPAWLVPATLLCAFAAGLAIDTVGNARHIGLLPPHLLAMLAWNVVVYALLAAQGLRAGSAAWLPLSWSRWLAARLAGLTRSPPPALARFIGDWVHASQTLQTARLAATLHTGAACFAAGAIVSMYARGSFFEFRAGWESTFLAAPQVHFLVTALLGPASWLSGIALPDEAGVAALDFARGNGEIAARWIHLFAVTIVAVIVLPRLLLAASAAWRARVLARDFPLPLNEPYFQRLLPRGAAAVPVPVWPYSYRVPAERAAALRAVLADDGAGLWEAQLRDNVPLGGEDEPARWLPAPGRIASPRWVALFNTTATPERETHGAFVQALAAQLPAGARLQVLVDEADMRQRFGDVDGANRIEQRRDAWRRMLEALGHEPRFVDLSERTATPEPAR